MNHTFFFFNLKFLKVKCPIEDSKFREKRSGENNHYCRSLFLTLQVTDRSANLSLGLSSKMAACVQEKATSATSITREEMETIIISFSSTQVGVPIPTENAL